MMRKQPTRTRINATACLAALFPVACVAAAGDGEFSGHVAAELRAFPNEGAYPGQADGGLSLSVQPEYRYRWGDGMFGLTVVPFYRWDSEDDERTHGDIRELMLRAVKDDWELRAGIGKVFWGVTESQHLVDVINQTDLVEDIDHEEKLGQPMVRLTRIVGSGSVDLFMLPWFRERTFPGEAGRFRPPLPVDTDRAFYESSREERHVDWAARWNQYIGPVDYGIYWFEGTSRDPDPVLQADDDGLPVLAPFYPQMTQFGLDAQYTGDAWLWKLEVIDRSTSAEDFQAAVGGFEYTLVGIGGSVADLGLLTEYNYDSRGEEATRFLQNDLFAGARLTLNDIQSTEVLAGVFHDLDYGSTSFRVEASRRIGDSMKLNLEAQLFDPEAEDPLSFYSEDDYLQLELGWYY